MRRSLLFLFVLLLLCTKQVANAQSSNIAPMKTSDQSQTPRPLVHPGVEDKARLLQDNNQDTYRALADEVFKAGHGFEVLSKTQGIGPANIPAPIDNVIKDRLVYAEMQYRQGRAKGVTEQSIVDFTNMLVQKLNLPDYARTTPAQVRDMRMWLIMVNPTLMGHGVVKGNMKVGDSISSELSPLQAAHLLLEVLGHKVSDPFFQLTPAEWDKAKQERETQRKAQLAAGQVLSQPTQQTAMLHTKTGEISSSVAQGINSMSLVDAFSLIDKGFEILGIGR
jgi:hypothetical protein